MQHIVFFVRIFKKIAAARKGFVQRLNLTFPAMCLIVTFVFISSFFYLAQKVNIYVSAYQLSDSYTNFQELTAKRDYLRYAFDKEISLPKINQWVSQNNFSFGSKEKVIALNLRAKEKPIAPGSKIASVFNRISGIGTAMARDNE